MNQQGTVSYEIGLYYWTATSYESEYNDVKPINAFSLMDTSIGISTKHAGCRVRPVKKK